MAEFSSIPGVRQTLKRLKKFTELLPRDREIKPPGSAPGTVVLVGERKMDQVRIRMIRYGPDSLAQDEFPNIEECISKAKQPGVKWINIDGLHDTKVIEKLGQAYQLHPLVLEDVANTTQRPKLEAYDGYLYVVMKMLYMTQEENAVVAEQVSFLLMQDCVISFQERTGDIFDKVRERIRNGKGRIRQCGPDYLLYALMDAIVDHYFVITERISDTSEKIDEELMHRPDPAVLRQVYDLKKEVHILRKSVWPLREVVSTIQRTEFELVKKQTTLFLRDVYDHTIQVLDTVEGLRDTLSGMMDMYQSSVGNRMNEVMKTLTIIATIFIPLTFVAGIYGMNFEHMPELGWRWGYFEVLGVMAVMACIMMLYFKRKGWF